MSDEEGAESASRSRAIIAWVVAPLVCIAFFPTILLLLIGMAPSIVAYVIDKRPRKVTARAIGYLNFAGCLPYALKLWTGQNTISGVLTLVGDPSALMIMYSSAAVGWTLNFIMAPIMAAYLAVQHEAKARSLSSRQEELIKEWGADVKGQFSPQEEAPQQIEEQSAEGAVEPEEEELEENQQQEG